MDNKFKSRYESRHDSRKKDGRRKDCKKGEKERRVTSRSHYAGRNNNCNRGAKDGKQSPNFRQILGEVKGRMDRTFRSLEKGLQRVERGINEELADVLAQVLDYEEEMKPQLLIPYRKCREFESLMAPVLARVPKRSSSENAGCLRKSKSRDKYRDNGRSKDPGKKFKELMYMSTQRKRAPCERLRERRASREVLRDRYDPPGDICGSSTSQEGDGDEVTKTMQELQDISASVNNSLRRISQAFNSEESLEGLRIPRRDDCRTSDSRPEMLSRVNESLSQTGAGAKMLKRLLVVEKTRSIR